MPGSLRYLIPDPVAAGSVEISVSGEELRFAELNYGPYAQSTLAQIESLQSSPEFRGDEYEVRLLRVPALSIYAIWLRSASGAEVFVPLAPTTSALIPGQSYSERAFLDAIRPEAEDVLSAALAAQESELAARVHAAVYDFSTADLLRLRSFAEWQVRGLGRAALKHGWGALLEEALARTFAGKHKWEGEVDLAAHLCQEMRNISQAWDRPSGASLESENWPGPKTFLADDPVALDAMNYLLLGHQGNKLQRTQTEWSKEYAHAFHRIRRKLQRSRSEVAEAINALEAAEFLYLRNFARARANLLRYLGKDKGRDEQDLLQEAIVATLEGRRTWNEEISLVKHLTGAMRSISSAWGQERAETHFEEEPVQSSTEGSPSSREDILPAVTIDPERIVQAREDLKRVHDLFSEDALALDVVTLRGQGFTSKEIQKQLAISAAEFEAASRRVRRTLNSSAHGMA